MTASNIKAESCYLHWDAPLDDGGSELTNYIVEKMEVMKEEPELEEGQEAPPEPQWAEVTNSIIDRKYGVSPPGTVTDLFKAYFVSNTTIFFCRCGTSRPTRPTCSGSELRIATANLTPAPQRKSRSQTHSACLAHQKNQPSQSTARLP